MHSHAPVISDAAKTTAVPPAAFAVGDWLVAPDLNEVRRGNRTQHVRPQLMDLLVYLARNTGRTVSRDELHANVWPTQPFITLTALPRCIAELRQTLGDCATGPTLIQTVPKRGYRLIAVVRPIEDAPAAPHILPAAAPVTEMGDAPATPHMLPAAAPVTVVASWFGDGPSVSGDVRLVAISASSSPASWTIRAKQFLSHALDATYNRLRT